ncbi:MAG: hypothetical protein ACLP3C_23295 [Mycobacterium sp.]|uniref:hypothetical protein n=1 Tax=Mycobacterium sp. TaxID=1785 RepID=UPI003F983561
MTSPYGERRKKFTETAKRGGETRKAKTLPSEIFDWDNAIARFKAMMAQRYQQGGDSTPRKNL